MQQKQGCEIKTQQN